MRFLFQNFKFSDTFYQTWLGIFGIAAIIAALDSIIVLFNPLKIAFTGLGLGWYLPELLTIALCGAYLYVIDYGLSIFLPTSIQTVVSNVRNKVRDKALWSIAILTLTFCAVQIAATIWVSLTLRHASAEMTLSKPELQDPTLVLGAQNTEGVQDVRNRIEALQTEKKEAIKRSQQHAELQRLANNGNGWASQKLKEKATNAAYAYDKKIESLDKERTTLLNTEANNKNLALASIGKVNDFKIKNYEHSTKALADFLLFFALFATLIEVFAGLMLGVYRSLYYREKGLQLVPNKVYTPAVGSSPTHGIYPYIQHLQNGKSYDTTKFTNWIRNSYNRNLTAVLESLRKSLVTHLLDNKEIDPALLSFCKDNPDIVGNEVNNTVKIFF